MQGPMLSVEVEDAVEPFTSNHQFDVSFVESGWGTEFRCAGPGRVGASR